MSRVRCPTTRVLSPSNTAKAIWDLMQLMEPDQGRLPTFVENGWKEMMTTGYIKRREALDGCGELLQAIIATGCPWSILNLCRHDSLLVVDVAVRLHIS